VLYAAPVNEHDFAGLRDGLAILRQAVPPHEVFDDGIGGAGGVAFAGDWKYLCRYLTENLSELAKATGAVERWRNIKSGEELPVSVIASGTKTKGSIKMTRSDLSSLGRREMARNTLLGGASFLLGAQNCVIANNVLHEGAMQRLILDQGGHAEGVVLRDNPGTLFKVHPDRG
jgi:hypothetical protein